MSQVEEIYCQHMREPLNQARIIGGADLVVGVPFLNETDTLADVVTAAAAGLRTFWPDRRAVVVCAGSRWGGPALKTLASAATEGVPIIGFLLADGRLSGKGWGVRAILEIAASLGAHVGLLEADLVRAEKGGEGVGMSPGWVKVLFAPILEGHVAMVLARFVSNSPGSCAGDHLVYPLLAALYNLRLYAGLEGEMALSRDLVADLVENHTGWPAEATGYGVDAWLVTRAAARGAGIGEVNLGVKRHRSSWGKLGVVFRHVAGAVFDTAARTQDEWLSRPAATRTALHFGPHEYPSPGAPSAPSGGVRPLTLRRSFNRFHDRVWQRILPEDLACALQELCRSPVGSIRLTAALWTSVLYHFLAAFRFESGLQRDDLLQALVPIFEARLASFAREVTDASPDSEDVRALAAGALLETQVRHFLAQKPEFVRHWRNRVEAHRPFLPEIGYWEFVPGVPLVLPHQVEGPEGVTASVAPIYENLLQRYRAQFQEFTQGKLGVGPRASSGEIAGAVHAFLLRVERMLDEALLPGDLTSVEGTRKVVNAIFDCLPARDTYSLKSEVAARFLRDHPPRNLMTRRGYSDPGHLLREHDPLDLFALAGWSEEPEYEQRCTDWMREAIRPEHFELSPVRPLVVDCFEFPVAAEMRETSPLARLASRIVVGNLRKGSAGEFPRLRYLTVIGKNLVEAERFGAAWESFSREPREFGKKVVSSIEGHWGREIFSAHYIFENGHQRELVERLRQLGRLLVAAAAEPERQLGQLLLDVADSYHLAFTLPDGQFVPCSAWTWASHSFKGGKGVPAPLSLHVERNWFTADLLLECYRAVGGTEEALEAKIVDLMGQGREAEDLACLLLGVPPRAGEVVVEQELRPSGVPAGRLRRFAGNPILEPVVSHAWESRYVLNCGAVRAGGMVHLFYRAVGDDGVSRIGLALSQDGWRIEERLPDPVFSPGHPTESAGCEDPRVTVIDDRMYMLYTAYDGVVPQVALASIPLEDLLARRWEAWRRHGLVFPGFPNKDAVLFPATFGGRYAMYHRIAPSIWLSFADTLDCPWPRQGHRMVLGPRSGMMWDANKIGAGGPPIRTRFGWLLLYHGVDYEYCYRLGVILTAFDDPGRVVYRSPNPILEPEEPQEVGVPGRSWVPNVVFSCGAVTAQDKDIVDVDDTIIVYYGAADTVIAVASIPLRELLPPGTASGVSAPGPGAPR